MTNEKNIKLEIPIVIMAGGKGTRLDPFTRILPKALIPINDKTILELIIEKFLKYSVVKFHLSINHKAKIIKSYFEELQTNYSIEYLYESKPLGTAGGLKQLIGKVEKELLVTNCDIIIDTNYTAVLDHHRKNGNDITLVASQKQYVIPYGICEIENGGELIKINEKPEYSLLISTGMYILNSEILKYIPDNQFYHMTHLIEEVKKNRGKIGVYQINEDSWIDSGEWTEFKDAVEKLKYDK
jgi:NDP-sugar pyrophosphorylase family protein